MSCTCQECGRPYNLDLEVPNHIWEDIKPEGSSERRGLLCPSCIIQHVEFMFDMGELNINRALLMFNTNSHDNDWSPGLKRRKAQIPDS
jgi:hypothetical protein